MQILKNFCVFELYHTHTIMSHTPPDIHTLRQWEFVYDDNDPQAEYVVGHRQNWGTVSERLYETSNIKYKIPLQDAFLIVTVNDGIYRLPYSSSFYIS